jgi:succinate dehydrogenase/fumarate reductase flavoprotein subunit
LLVAGAGMAGLVATARLRELGARPTLIEKGSRAGGSMLLSSCVIWRHRTLDDARAECPAADPALQRLVVERLDEGIAWLESLGAEPVWEEPGNPRTAGKRFDPGRLTDVLVRAAGEPLLETPFPGAAEQPVVLATGGFPVRLARERGLLVRSNPWSDGAGVAFGRSRGGGLTAGMGEFYGRNMPAPPARIEEGDFVPLAQLYGRFAQVENDEGRRFFEREPSWSETDLVQATADQPGGRAWYLVDTAALTQRVRERSVAEMVEAARASGGTVERRADGRLAVHVMAAVTHTVGGLRVDARARVLDERGEPIDGLHAAGVDAGGFSTGGYASGLAQALVLGLAAAEDIAGC